MCKETAKVAAIQICRTQQKENSNNKIQRLRDTRLREQGDDIKTATKRQVHLQDTAVAGKQHMELQQVELSTARLMLA